MQTHIYIINSMDIGCRVKQCRPDNDKSPKPKLKYYEMKEKQRKKK